MSPRYRYSARDWSAANHRGILSAPGKIQALEQLRSRGLIVVDLKELSGLTRGTGPRLSNFLEQLLRRKARSRDFMVFCRQFATMTRAGMTALHSLQVLAGQMEQQLFRSRLQAAALSLEQGSSLSESFHRQGNFFPGMLVNMIEAGESGGVLDTVLERLADHYERQHDLEEKIRSATAYPLFITGVAAAVLVVMVLFVLPQFDRIFDAMGLEMPRFARSILAASHFTLEQWPLLLGLLAAAAAAAAWYRRTEQGRYHWDRLRLHLPFFGAIYRKALAARFSRTMGILLGSGVPLISSLELVDRVMDNRVISRSLQRTCDGVTRGQPMADPLEASGLFPTLLVEMVRVGEETGALDEMLGRTAVFYERDVSYVVDRLGTLLEPILLLIVGLFVGLLVFSIISPMYQVFQMI